MAVNSCEEGQDAYSISVSPDEDTTNLQCELQLAITGHSEVPNTTNNQMCLGAEMNCRNHINLEMDNADSYLPYIVDMDIEKGNSGAPKTNDKAVEKLKIEGPLTKALQRQISFQIGEKFMQLLMNGSFVLPKHTSRDKPMTEKVHETPNNRVRKYKRSASFNSRKVVLLFSVLSSMGTMILIYMTLRVRQIGDIGSIQAAVGVFFYPSLQFLSKSNFPRNVSISFTVHKSICIHHSSCYSPVYCYLVLIAIYKLCVLIQMKQCESRSVPWF